MTRRALVTGAGSERGIGFACARALAAAGMELALTATTDRIHERAQMLGASGHIADLTDPAQVQRLADAVGAVDVLVCNAGMAQTGAALVDRTFLELDAPAWETELARTLSTAFLTARAFAPAMAARGYGRIVMVSSVTGPRTALPGSAAYGAAKAGMEGLMRGMALELAPARGDGERGRARLDRDGLVVARRARRGRAHPRPATRHARRGRCRRRVPREPRGLVCDRALARRGRRQHAPGGPLAATRWPRRPRWAWRRWRRSLPACWHGRRSETLRVEALQLAETFAPRSVRQPVQLRH
jgi:hypothetical protein